MPDEPSFQGVLARLRAGEQQAAAELVPRYQDSLLRVIRVRLLDSRLKRLLDPQDVCQSVLASFFVRLSLGHYDLTDAEDLQKLLVTMACNKVAGAARKQRAARRGGGQIEAVPLEEGETAASGPSPSEALTAAELLERARALLCPEERQVAEQRSLGKEWADIAAELGVGAEALRKRQARAVERVAELLDLD